MTKSCEGWLWSDLIGPFGLVLLRCIGWLGVCDLTANRRASLIMPNHTIDGEGDDELHRSTCDDDW